VIARRRVDRIASSLAPGAALALALVSCAPSSQADSRKAPAPPASKTPSGATPTAGASMSAFKDSLQKFTAAVAAAYGKKPSELQVTPPSEDIVGFDDENLGDLIAFQATSGELKVRGFASKAAVVLARSNEYGPLFQAAHALDAKALPATDIASRIVWMLGPENNLVTPTTRYPKYPVPPKVGPPVLDHQGGRATLHFYYLTFDTRMPGAPPTPFAAEVQVSADYKAQLTTSPGP
jgi:hypothetical protein